MPWIEARDATRLYYKDWGSGKPIVFVHSFLMNSDMWQYQMAPLSEQGLRCIALDRRGHGRSDTPGRGYDCDTLADDLAQLIEQLELREVTIVGHSMGAAEVVRYLSRSGAAAVARVVFLAPTTPFLLKTEDNPDGVDAGFFEQQCELWRCDLPKWLAENSAAFFVSETSEEMRLWVRSLALQCSLKAVLECQRVYSAIDFRDELRSITLPTLVIQGDMDASVPIDLTGRRTAQLIPDSRLVVYEGAPHGLMFTHMRRLNCDLLAFVQE